MAPSTAPSPRHAQRLGGVAIAAQPGLRATTANNRQSSAAAKTPGCALASTSSNTPADAARRIRFKPLHSRDDEADALEQGHQLPRAVLDLVVVVHRLVRAQPPHGPVGRVEAEPPAGCQDAERLACHLLTLGLGDVLNGLAAVDEVEGAVLVAPEVDHGVEGELHRAELGEHRLAGRATLVDLVSLLDGEVDHHEALEGIGVAEVDERAVGQALVGAAEVEDARGAGQAGDELAAAHVHGEQDVADGDAPAELLGVGQRLGDAVARELARRQLLAVVGTTYRVGLTVEDDVERHTHRLLRRQEAERHRRDRSVKDAIDPSLPLVSRHSPHCGCWARPHTIPDAKPSGPSPEGETGDGPEASAL